MTASSHVLRALEDELHAQPSPPPGARRYSDTPAQISERQRLLKNDWLDSLRPVRRVRLASCRQCGRKVRLESFGIAAHQRGGRRCPGTGLPPAGKSRLNEELT